MKKYILPLLTFWLVGTGQVFAQNNTKTLSECLQIALDSNLSIVVAHEGVAFSHEKSREASSSIRPKVSAAFDYRLYGNLPTQLLPADAFGGPSRVYKEAEFGVPHILNPMGFPVQVSQFAAVVKDRSPSLLERKDRQPAVTLTADALGRPSGTVADEVVAYLKKNPLPPGMQLAWGSDIKRQNDSFGALGSVLAISFLLIYLIMVALYDSFVYPLVALFSIPVAAIRAFLALNLSLSNLSLFALLGLIMLMGLVTKNAILIVDFTNQLKAEGKHFKEALILAGEERMRPILMTTLAMAVGMLPIAMAKGTASEWKNGLAWVIIGGLLSSLILTVYLVPMMYYLVDTVKEKIKSK